MSVRSQVAHVPDMTAVAMYGKTFKNLIWNQKAGVIEIWYTASGTGELSCLLKLWPQIDFWPFYGKIKFVHFGILMKKKAWGSKTLENSQD